MNYETLYEVQSKSEHNVSIKLSDETHEVFQAHFPEQAILPGFIHFEIVSNLFAIEIKTIKRAKFMQMVLPAQTLRYERTKNKFKVFCQNDVVASFSI